jgi:hypothetical protein
MHTTNTILKKAYSHVRYIGPEKYGKTNGKIKQTVGPCFRPPTDRKPLHFRQDK